VRFSDGSILFAEPLPLSGGVCGQGLCPTEITVLSQKRTSAYKVWDGYVRQDCIDTKGGSTTWT
jgi:hypothetical protein